MNLWDEFRVATPDRKNALYAALKIMATGRGREMLDRYVPGIERQNQFIERVRAIQDAAAETATSS